MHVRDSDTLAVDDREPEKAGRYFTAYNCDRDPFSDEGISGLFFSGGERGKIVDELQHACRFMRSPVFLSGRQGSGKTAVLREFGQRAQGAMDVAVVSVELLQADQQILTNVMRTFGHVVDDESSLWEQYVSWIGVQTSRQRHVVVCFDDADNLDGSFLRPFIELVQHTEGYFTLVLAGPPDLESKLEALVKPFDFTLNVMALPNFDENQVLEYAGYRLRAAGFKGEIPLTDIQVKAAQRRSNGNIAYLNELLRDMLVAGRQSRQGLKLDFPKLHAVLIVLLIVIVLVFAVQYQSASERPASESPPLRLATVEDLSQGANVAEKSAGTIIEEDGASAADNRQVPVKSEEIAPNLSETADTVGLDGASVTREPEPASVVLAAENTEDDSAQSSVPAQPDKAPEQPATAAPQLADVDSELAAGAQPAVTEVANPVENQLSGWPDTGYALQVFGTHNAQRARQLVSDFSSDADLLFYETLHNGKPWFVVIAGPFSGRQSAQASISGLPGSLQRLRPWPRNIASIKGDIERYRLIQQKNWIDSSLLLATVSPPK